MSNCVGKGALIGAASGLIGGAIGATAVRLGGAVIGKLLGSAAEDAGVTTVSSVTKEAGVTVLSKGDQASLNRGLGNAWRDEVAVQMDQLPNRMATTEVYKPTPFGKRFIDVEVSDSSGNVLGGIETKFGNAPYTVTQRLKDMWLYRMQGYRVNVLEYPGP
jgi:hypothetical protein